MRCKGRHYYFVCACTVLFSLCSLCLTTTHRHSHFTPADFNAGRDRVVSQPGHRLSGMTFVANFLSHDGKYGRVLYTRQRSLRSASFPIHYNPYIRRYTGCNCNLHGLQWGQGGEAIWDREHVVRNITFTQKLRLLGAPQGSYLWHRCRNRRKSGSYNSGSVWKLFRTGQGSSEGTSEYDASPQHLQWSWCPHFEQILWIN